MSEAAIALGDALNAQQRQQMGRYLYRLQAAGQRYWLKLQQQALNSACEQSFLHELQCYTEIQRLSESRGYSILLDFEIVDPYQHYVINPAQPFYPQALRVQDSQALFATAPTHFDQVLQVLFQSLASLEQLHNLGYLHADLKTDHFRLLERRCYLIDFEQALRIDQAQARAVTGTPRYMAPELFHGQAKSMQTEIYALGMIWWQWLQPQRIQQVDYLAWAKWHCQDFRVQLIADYAALMPVLSGMLSKSPARRYVHIREIKQALTALI